MQTKVVDQLLLDLESLSTLLTFVPVEETGRVEDKT